MAESGYRRPIRVILHSGLGNQMFQYAAAKALAVGRGRDLLIDPITGFRNDPYQRRYELGAFRLSSRCLPEAHVPARSLWVRLMCRATRELEIASMRRRGCYYLPLLQRVSLRCAGVVFGYWQSPRYFKEIEASLREEYRLKEEPSPVIRQWSERLQGCESVGVHVRPRQGVSAGGQLVSPGSADSGRREALLDYYRTAIACLKGRVSDPYWFVVSDSAQFDPGRLGLPCDTPVLCGDSRRSPAEDLWLLSQARHKIIGPSTFGWWAAWLSDLQSGSVCVPSVFTPGGGRRPSRGIYASGWIILGDSASPRADPCIR